VDGKLRANSSLRFSGDGEIRRDSSGREHAVHCCAFTLGYFRVFPPGRRQMGSDGLRPMQVILSRVQAMDEDG